jgi:hypothetical protein
MDKDLIKKLLREFVENTLDEAKRKNTKRKKNKKKIANIDKDYASLQNKLLDSPILTQAGVMQAAGLGNANDASDRSLFSKKVRKAKNDDGGIYKFNDEELGDISKVVNNPLAFTSGRTRKIKKRKKKTK